MKRDFSVNIRILIIFVALIMKNCIALLLASALVSLSLHSQELPSTGNAGIISPEISGHEVTFRFPGEYLTETRLDGSWLSEPVLMDKHNGLWEITLNDVPSGLMTYSFVVDGVRTFDTANPFVLEDGRELHSAFIIDGDAAVDYRTGRRCGNIEFVTMNSKLFGGNRRAAVYTPYGYNANSTKLYPVLYLLHGDAGDEESWLSIGRVAVVLDNMISKGKAVPMIVVMPDCRVDVRAGQNVSSLPSSIVNELIPFVESHYKVNKNASARAIAGVSSGADITMDTARLYPAKFDFICPLGCVSQNTDNMKEDFLRIKNAKVNLLWMGCGSYDNVSLQCSDTMHEVMSEIHLFHTYYKNAGGHDWGSWRLYMVNFLPMLFKYYE